MSTKYGIALDLSVYGGSHDSEIGVYIAGLPQGIKIDRDVLAAFLARRAPGQNEYSTTRQESDVPIFLSGLAVDGTLTGEPLHAVIQNTDARHKDYPTKLRIPRPSHADFAAYQKYKGNIDLRGGGIFSGRLTAPLCVAGGICLQILATRGIDIAAHIYTVKDIADTPFDPVRVGKHDFDILRSHSFPTLDEEKGTQMRRLILDAKEAGDSVGGIAETAVTGLPVGIGEHMFYGLESRISSIVFSVPAVKGVEFGDGFASSHLYGSENNDPFRYDESGNVRTSTNHAGGILGGMSNGMPLLFRAAVKPTPSIAIEQNSVDLVTHENVKLRIPGRHDPCILPRIIPVMEAVTAIAILDAILTDKRNSIQ